MSIRTLFHFRSGRAASWQLVLVIAVWVFLCALHWENDGLWHQGDSTRHASNGIFWKDYLQSFSLDAKGYALSYYARYPVINPVAYPPFFYLLEGAMFGIFGPSPYVGKGLVLLFALMAAVYTMAWLRRWVTEEAGWGGALVLLLPGVVLWSHAIVLNVPSFALSAATLYHARRWLETPTSQGLSRDFWAAVILAIMAILTYYQSFVVVFIIVAWLIELRRWKWLSNPRAIALLVFLFLLMVPFALLVWRWAPMYVRWALPGWDTVWSLQVWTYYPTHIEGLIGYHILVLAAVGVVAGLLSPRYRRQTLIFLIWLAVMYVTFSYVAAKLTRYVLLATTPLVCLCMIAIFSIRDRIAELIGRRQPIIVTGALAAMVILLAIQAWQASRIPVPSVRGFEEVAAFIEEVAPAEPVFYSGYYSGNFTFYLLAGDPDFLRQVIVGHKLLYAVAHGWGLEEFVSSPGEVLEVLKTRGGCRWLAIANMVESPDTSYVRSIAAGQHLREAVKGPEFELVKSFPIDSLAVDRVDVYRLLAPVERHEEVDLPFPVLGKGVRYRVRPIPSRSRGIDDD